ATRSARMQQSYEREGGCQGGHGQREDDKLPTQTVLGLRLNRSTCRRRTRLRLGGYRETNDPERCAVVADRRVADLARKLMTITMLEYQRARPAFPEKHSAHPLAQRLCCGRAVGAGTSI